MRVRMAYKRLFLGVVCALTLAAGVRIATADGIHDALCALLEPGSAAWILAGCSTPPDPYGS